MFLKKIMVILAILTSLYGIIPQRIEAGEPEIKTQEQYIKEIFGANARIATAVLKHESGMNLTAINYNCRYNGKSTSCKKGDEYKAWSVDCGLAQVNVKGQVCPKELLTLEGNMKAVERIYQEQGLNAWVSWKSGAYKQYL
jgi:hypothetical protein